MFKQYGFCRDINLPFGETLSTTISALQTTGFEIVASLDMHSLTVDDHPHTVLKVWDQTLVRRILCEEPALSLFVPFNVVVHGRGPDHSTVCMPDPIQMFQGAEGSTVEAIAHNLNSRIWSAYLKVVTKQAYS